MKKHPVMGVLIVSATLAWAFLIGLVTVCIGALVTGDGATFLSGAALMGISAGLFLLWGRRL